MIMIVTISTVSAAPQAWGSDGAHGKKAPTTSQSAVMSNVGVGVPKAATTNTQTQTMTTMATNNAVTMATMSSAPTSGTCMDNSKKIAIYMPVMTNPVYSESTGGYVNTPVTFDPMTTAMLFEYNPDYLGDSSILSINVANYGLLIVPMCQMSTGAATAINAYIASGGSVWFMNDPCLTTTGSSSVQLTSLLGNGVSTAISSASTVTVVNTDSITSGLPVSFKPVGGTSKTNVFRALSGSNTLNGLNYQVLMNSGSAAMLVKFENPTTGARVIYSNPNMFISGGTSSYFNAKTATQLFMQTKAWIMKFAQNPSGVSVTYPGGDRQLTVTCDDEEATSWDVAITPMINAENALTISPSAVNTFFIIPSADVTKAKIQYYAGYGDTHTLHPHLTIWDTVSKTPAQYGVDITNSKNIINTAMGTSYGFTSWRFPMTTYCANSMQAVSDSGVVIESSNGVDGTIVGTVQDNTLFLPKQVLVNNAKTNMIEYEVPAGFDIDYSTGATYAAAYNAYSSQFKNVNLPANFVVSGHYQGIGTNCGVTGWGVTSTGLTAGLTSILTAQKAAYPNYATFDKLSTYISGIRSAKITASFDGVGTTTVVVTNSKAINGFTLKAGVGTVNSATCDGTSVTVSKDAINGASYITKDLIVGTHVFVISTTAIPPTVITPIASFTPITSSGTSPYTVTFTSSTTGTSPTLTWDFGDGVTGTGSPISHQFINTGTTAITRAIKLTATNSAGTSIAIGSVVINPASITPIKPTVSFTATPLSGTTPLTVTFTSTSTGTPTPTITWKFSDGGTAAGSPVTHVFTNTGTTVLSRTATVTATNSAGTATAVKTITVNPSTTKAIKPAAYFTCSVTSGTTATTFTFKPDCDNNPTSFVWTFGDGVTQTLTSATATTHKYTKAGTYNVVLTVSNTAGSDYDDKSVTVK